MLSAPAQVKRVLDENLFLLQVLNLDFKLNQTLEVDQAYNLHLEKTDDPLLVGLKASSQTLGYRQQHYVDTGD